MAFAAKMGFSVLLKYDSIEPAWHWLKTEWAWLWMEWYATYNNQSETHFVTCLQVTKWLLCRSMAIALTKSSDASYEFLLSWR